MKEVEEVSRYTKKAKVIMEINIDLQKKKIFIDKIHNTDEKILLSFKKKFTLFRKIVNVTCDESLNIARIFFKEGDVSIGNISFDDYDIVADYNEDNEIIGIEFLSLSKKLQYDICEMRGDFLNEKNKEEEASFLQRIFER